MVSHASSDDPLEPPSHPCIPAVLQCCFVKTGCSRRQISRQQASRSSIDAACVYRYRTTRSCTYLPFGPLSGPFVGIGSTSTQLFELVALQLFLKRDRRESGFKTARAVVHWRSKSSATARCTEWVKCVVMKKTRVTGSPGAQWRRH